MGAAPVQELRADGKVVERMIGAEQNRNSRAPGGATVCGVALQFDSPRRSALAKIKAEVIRIGTNGTRQGFKFAEKMFKGLPELKDA